MEPLLDVLSSSPFNSIEEGERNMFWKKTQSFVWLLGFFIQETLVKHLYIIFPDVFLRRMLQFQLFFILRLFQDIYSFYSQKLT